MGIHFLLHGQALSLESCNWVENFEVINVLNYGNVSYIFIEFLENTFSWNLTDVTFWWFTVAFGQWLIGRANRWLWAELAWTNIMESYSWGRMCDHDNIMESYYWGRLCDHSNLMERFLKVFHHQGFFKDFVMQPKWQSSKKEKSQI
jgi:hypothetical protein